MKCPKCDYLGFETGDRCKNCGYDFSLMTDSMVRDADLVLREPDSVSGPNDWLKQLDRDVELNPSGDAGAGSRSSGAAAARFPCRRSHICGGGGSACRAAPRRALSATLSARLAR